MPCYDTHPNQDVAVVMQITFHLGPGTSDPLTGVSGGRRVWSDADVTTAGRHAMFRSSSLGGAQPWFKIVSAGEFGLASG